MSRKYLNYKSLDSLEPIVKIVNEANEAISNPNRIIANSAVPEVLFGALGMGAGSALSFTALYTLGTVGLSAAGITSGLAAAGGGASLAVSAAGLAVSPMVAGVFVLAAPVAVLTGTGVFVASKIKNGQLKQEKDRLYKEALKKHDAIISELKQKQDMTKERIEYLTSLNILLQQAIKELGADLENASNEK